MDTKVFSVSTGGWDNHFQSDYLLETLKPDFDSQLIRLTCTFVLRNSHCKCIGCDKDDVLILCSDCLDVLRKRRKVADKLKGI